MEKYFRRFDDYPLGTPEDWTGEPWPQEPAAGYDLEIIDVPTNRVGRVLSYEKGPGDTTAAQIMYPDPGAVMQSPIVDVLMLAGWKNAGSSTDEPSPIIGASWDPGDGAEASNPAGVALLIDPFNGQWSFRMGGDSGETLSTALPISVESSKLYWARFRLELEGNPQLAAKMWKVDVVEPAAFQRTENHAGLDGGDFVFGGPIGIKVSEAFQNQGFLLKQFAVAQGGVPADPRYSERPLVSRGIGVDG